MDQLNIGQPQILKGTFEECLKDFVYKFNIKFPPGTENIRNIRVRIGDFCGVGDKTVRHWLSGRDIPNGRSRIALACYLQIHGYQVLDLEKLSVTLRNTAELIGYGVVSTDEIYPVLGYLQIPKLYLAIRENYGLTRERKHQLDKAYEERRVLLEAKKKESLGFMLEIPFSQIEQAGSRIEIERGDEEMEDNAGEAKEVLRDHLEGCLRHLASRFSALYPPNSRGRSDYYRPMADFFGTTSQTIQRWLTPGTENFGIYGKSRIKLMCYLDFHGYKVIEFERLTSNSKVLRNFSELIGYDVLSVEDAYKLLEFNSAGRLYEVLKEEVGLAKTKEEKMWQIWKDYRDALEVKKREALSNFGLNLDPNNKGKKESHLLKKEVDEPVVVRPINVPEPVGVPIDGRHKAILGILENCVELIDTGLFEELSNDQLASFARPILQLSSKLSFLGAKVIVVKGDPKNG